MDDSAAMAGRTRRGAELTKFFVGAALICAVPVFLRFAPAWAERFYPQCLWRMITGLYCPGCGTLRAFRSLAEFDFVAAFMYNPFLFLLVIPLVVYLCAIYLIRVITGRWVPSFLSSPKAVLPVAGVIACVWVFRNVFPLGLGLG